MIESQRHIGDKVTIDRRYFISSLSETDELFSKAVRHHWSVENELHWMSTLEKMIAAFAEEIVLKIWPRHDISR